MIGNPFYSLIAPARQDDGEMGEKIKAYNNIRKNRVRFMADDPFKTQIGGDYYTKRAIQPFEYSMKNGLDPMQHTIIKYVDRFRDKGGKQDLLKARHVIDLLIDHEYGGEQNDD